jgi:hypothetical protein
MHSGTGTRNALTVSLLSTLLVIAVRPAHAQTETVLYNFSGGGDGSLPYASLILDNADNLYGTTSAGGSGEAGVVFEVTP